MKVVVLIFLASALISDCKYTKEDDFPNEITKSKNKIRSDYLVKLWQGANEAIAESQDKILKLYTEYTIQQAQQVIDHISQHRNLTVSESADKRATVAGTKNSEKLVSILDCIFAREADTLRAYKLTGYNLHNCIRMAQTETETKFLEIIKNLKKIKYVSVWFYNHYVKTLDNCVESLCVVSNRLKATLDYLTLTEDVSTNMTEFNNISTRYVFTHIAMECISESIAQISENYEIGKALVDECLAPPDESRPTNLPDIVRETREFP